MNVELVVAFHSHHSSPELLEQLAEMAMQEFKDYPKSEYDVLWRVGESWIAKADSSPVHVYERLSILSKDFFGEQSPLRELLPGFVWLSWKSFFLGLVEAYAYGWYLALVWIPIYNYFSARARQSPDIEARWPHQGGNEHEAR